MRVLIALILGSVLLTPLFAFNVLGTAPRAFFQDWDHFSGALVLAKIESTVVGAPPATTAGGLLVAQPNPIAPYDTFNGLRDGAASTSTGYQAYPVQVGLQGYIFTGLYGLGCTSVRCLETANAAMTAAAIVGFALALTLVAPRSFAVAFLITAVGSPWVVSSARNLYWVPWSFVLPAIAATCFVTARSRRTRIASVSAVFVLFALRFSMGFEFLTTLSLLATCVPLVAHAFHDPSMRGGRRALRDAAVIFAASVAAFVVILFATAVIGGRGDLGSGLNTIYQYALVRTYGGSPTDAVSQLALTVSPVAVVGIYLIGWTTSVVDLGWTPIAHVAVGQGALLLLIAASAVIVIGRRIAGDGRWRRDAVLLVIALAIPMSWFVLAKGHSFVHTPIDFLLWYLLGVSTLAWIVLARVVQQVRRMRSRLVPVRDQTISEGGTTPRS